MSAPVYLYNPLPAALHHFQRELVDVLSTAGVPLAECRAPSAELGGSTGVARVRAAVTELTGRLRRDRRGGHVLVCWPTYGLLEPALWLPTAALADVSVVVHDPSPLRRQPGMGDLSARLGGLAARWSRVRVIVHSAPASARLVSLGWPRPHRLPHPILLDRVTDAAGGERSTVLVCGQYKPARDLRLLAELGYRLTERGFRPVIAGRGWPLLPSWQVVDRFLPEAELDRRMLDSAAVLVPYSHFYQSGIAVRAMELGVPVVGPDHPFLAELFGVDWPGLVSDNGASRADDWADAIRAVAGRGSDVERSAKQFRVRCEREWSDYFAH
ncbi:MAG TPA: hypothetical protein VFE65_12025 [Pseudonocardia sp.]|nr:hypothetical protein [Pseudonocardia sp.]